MAINLSNFKEGTSIANTDFFVGYTNSKKSGERRWKWSTIFNKLDTSFHTAKAWVNFNGDGPNGKLQIRSQFNVSAVTRFGEGRYKISFSNSVGANRVVAGAAEIWANTNRGMAFSILNRTTADNYVNNNTSLDDNYVWIQVNTVDSDPQNYDSKIVTVVVF